MWSVHVFETKEVRLPFGPDVDYCSWLSELRLLVIRLIGSDTTVSDTRLFKSEYFSFP